MQIWDLIRWFFEMRAKGSSSTTDAQGGADVGLTATRLTPWTRLILWHGQSNGELSLTGNNMCKPDTPLHTYRFKGCAEGEIIRLRFTHRCCAVHPTSSVPVKNTCSVMTFAQNIHSFSSTVCHV